MKKACRKLLLFLCVVGIAVICSGCCLVHEWEEATCTEPKTCVKCEKEDGEPLGHMWSDATCTEAKTCSVCGETEGSALGHKAADADCISPSVCEVCGVTVKEALGHDWQEATCTEPKTCNRCSETEGDPLGHSWTEATCTEPKACARCEATEGEALGHAWIEATCTAKKQCPTCGVKTGSPLGHEYEKNLCIRCEDKLISNYDELVDYLNKNYHTLSTPLGDVAGISYSVWDHDPPLYYAYDYELKIETSLFVDEIKYSLGSIITADYYPYEDRLATFVALVEFEHEVAQIAMDAFPDKKVLGCFYQWGYEYAAVQVGFHDKSYLPFCNYDGPMMGFDYSTTKISNWRINEYGGDQFIDPYKDEHYKLLRDVKKETGYDITFWGEY